MANLVNRSLSRERLNSDTSKTYIRISSQNSSIREVSPTKKMEPKLGLGQPLKSTEILQNLPKNEPKKQERKISFTTEKTIVINEDSTIKEEQKVRKVSIDINYVYEHEQTNKQTEISTENEASKRRISLERRFQERSSSLSSMSTSSSNSSVTSETSSESSISTPEPMPRQSKQRKISRNINIILEDEISNENSDTCAKNLLPKSGLNLPKPKTSFHRRFSQDHSSMNVNIQRSTESPLRKISLQNNSTINTDR